MPRHNFTQDNSKKLTEDSRAICDASKVLVAMSKDGIARAQPIETKFKEQAKARTHQAAGYVSR
jgi:hypothetical protein